jgi:hypothetical protein
MKVHRQPYHSEAFNFGGNALFRKRLAKKGRTISSTVSLAYNDSKQRWRPQYAEYFL